MSLIIQFFRFRNEPHTPKEMLAKRRLKQSSAYALAMLISLGYAIERAKTAERSSWNTG
jgi:hypothetical protein